MSVHLQREIGAWNSTPALESRVWNTHDTPCRRPDGRPADDPGPFEDGTSSVVSRLHDLHDMFQTVSQTYRIHPLSVFPTTRVLQPDSFMFFR